MDNKLKNPAGHKISCNICHAEFVLQSRHLHDEEVTLLKDFYGISIAHKVMLTYLECPHCGKRYIVIMDDESTLPTLTALREVTEKCYKHASKHRDLPQKLVDKRIKLNRKLDNKRRELSEKFRGSHYQLGDCDEQLDYCYRAQ